MTYYLWTSFWLFAINAALKVWRLSQKHPRIMSPVPAWVDALDFLILLSLAMWAGSVLTGRHVAS